MGKDEVSKNLYQSTARVLFQLSFLCLISFTVITLFGFKNYTSILIGAGSFEFFDIFRGMTYVCFYFVTISLVPIMLLSSLILTSLDRR